MSCINMYESEKALLRERLQMAKAKYRNADLQARLQELKAKLKKERQKVRKKREPTDEDGPKYKKEEQPTDEDGPKAKQSKQKGWKNKKNEKTKTSCLSPGTKLWSKLKVASPHPNLKALKALPQIAIRKWYRK